MIKLQVIGHLGKDATVNKVGANSVINFSVAHTESYKDSKGERVEKTVWVECAKWGESTAVADYLKKGGQVFVEGTPEVRTYETGGITKASLALRVLNLQLLGSGKGNTGAETASNGATARAPREDAKAAQDDDLPF